VAEPWLSAQETAARLGVTKDIVNVWIAEKGMPAHWVGRQWKLQVGEVDGWVLGGGPAPAATVEPPARSDA
jgi:excisionase family DNA binding protein